jgi:hypothetical protein
MLIDEAADEIERLRAALQRIADNDYPASTPIRYSIEALQEIARRALEGETTQPQTAPDK